MKEVVKKYEDLSKQTVKVCKLQQEKLESARMKKVGCMGVNVHANVMFLILKNIKYF